MGELLKFITCGSVDDGKSTLIGRILYDSKLLYADQEEALILDSKIGSRQGEIDYSLLLDGLMAEREQGITIDVAYRYFTTNKRSFIVADTPGHEEYTRNMAVGASFAQLAVILIDAARGVLLQTKRHTRICALMGISQFVFAVNKMDLIGYKKEIFDGITADIHKLCEALDLKSVYIIPLSATEGDNVTRKSDRLSWYTGKVLLDYLETVDKAALNYREGFFMPVQRVCRPSHAFRGFQGQIESGEIQVGDEITALPSNEKAIVKGIIQSGSEVQASVKGRAVTIQLDKEVDVSRGCVLAGQWKPSVGNSFTAELLCMDDTPLVAGRNYILQLGTKRVPAVITNIKHKIDVNTGDKVKVDSIFKNEIAICDISVSEKIIFDAFNKSHVLGSLILVDYLSHMTSACGVVLQRLSRSDNLEWQEMDVTREQRSNQKNQNAKTIWFTGLSGAGKSTLANEVEKRLFALGRHTMTLDGDNVRLGLNKNLGFKEEDRMENIRRIAEVSKLMNDAGLIVIVSIVSPFERGRMNAKEVIGSDDFIQVYVSTPLKECENRDVKGLYKKEREGKIPDFTGTSSIYEVPEHPDITIDTSHMSIEAAGDYLMEKLKSCLHL